jgi:DNA-binding MarR family transcriptional regulator
MKIKNSLPNDIKTLEEFGQFRRSLNLLFTNALRPLGLGVKQALILRFLSKRGKASLAELSRDTATDPAGMTRVIGVLMKQKVLHQSEHATDKRRWVMSLTPKGKKLAEDVEDIYRSLSDQILKVLGREEKDQFTQTLQKLSRGLSQKKERLDISDQEGETDA